MFMSDVLGMYSKRPQYTTTDGREVYVPLGYTRSSHGFSTDLVFDKAGRLDVARSTHMQPQRKVRSDEDKAWRAKMREALRPLTDLWEFKLQDVVAAYAPGNGWRHPGKPFVGRNYNGDSAARDLQALSFGCTLWELNKATTPLLLQQYDLCAKHILAVQDYKGDDMKLRVRAIETSVINSLDALFMGVRWKYENLPMFAETYPQRIFFD
jgi:hypothetical protein